MATTTTTSKPAPSGNASPAPSPFAPKPNPNQTIRPAPATTTPAPASSSQQTQQQTGFVKQNPNQSTQQTNTTGGVGPAQRPNISRSSGGGSSRSSSTQLSSQETQPVSFAQELPASRPAQPLLSSSQQSSSQVSGGNLSLGGKNYSVPQRQLPSQQRQVSRAEPVRSQVELRPDFMQLAQARQEQRFVNVNPNQSVDYNNLRQVFGGNPLEPTYSLATPRVETRTTQVRENMLVDGNIVTNIRTNEFTSFRSFGTALEAQRAQSFVTPSQRVARQELSLQGQALALQRERENAELQQIANQNRGFIRTTVRGLSSAYQESVGSSTAPLPSRALLAQGEVLFGGGLSPNIKSNIQRTVTAQYRGARDLLSGDFGGFFTNVKESASGAFGLLSAPTQQASFVALSKEEKAFFKANPQIVTGGFNRRDESLSFGQNLVLGLPLVEPITQEALSFTSRPIGGILGKAQTSFISGATEPFRTQAERRLATSIAVKQKEATIFGQGVADVVTSGGIEAFGKSSFVVGRLAGRSYQATTEAKLARRVAIDISKQIALRAGPAEAFINVQTQAGSRGQTASYSDIGLGVFSGSLSAGTASFVQNYPRLTGNKFLTRVANVATYGTDPSELLGDIGEQSVANIRISRGERLNIPEVSLGRQGNLRTATIRNVQRTVENPFGFESAPSIRVRSVEVAFNPTINMMSNKRSSILDNPLMSTRSTLSSRSQSASRSQTTDIDTFLNTQTTSRTSTQAQANILTNPQTSIQSSINTQPNVQTTAESRVQTNTQSAVNSYVNPNTSSFINFFPALLPPDFGGGAGRGQKRRRSGKGRKAYTRDVTAVLFGNLFKPPKGKGYKQSLAVQSGLGVRF